MLLVSLKTLTISITFRISTEKHNGLPAASSAHSTISRPPIDHDLGAAPGGWESGGAAGGDWNSGGAGGVDGNDLNGFAGGEANANGDGGCRM